MFADGQAAEVLAGRGPCRTGGVDGAHAWVLVGVVLEVGHVAIWLSITQPALHHALACKDATF